MPGRGPDPEPAEPELLAKISKQCHREHREDGGEDSLTLSLPRKGAGLGRWRRRDHCEGF